MSLLKPFLIVTLACLPLVTLTVGGFLGTASSSTPIDPLPAFTPSQAIAAKLADVVASRTAVAMELANDPAGWRNGNAASAHALPYRLAASLQQAAQAGKSDDTAAVDHALSDLQALIAGDAKAIEQLSPEGQAILNNLKQRAARLKLHHAWLMNRMTIRDSLANAARSIATAPGGQAEKACLTLLESLGDTFPNVVADDDPAEPSDARTMSEDREIKAMATRAKFRMAYGLACGLSDNGASNAESFKQQWDALKGFLRTYPDGPPDDRDRPLLADARQRVTQAELAFRKQHALEAATAAELAANTEAWLKAINASAPDQADGNAAEVIEMRRTWLATRITSLPTTPDSLKTMQEGLIDDGTLEGKRRIGVFQQVPGDAMRYRWWKNNTQRVEKDPQEPKELRFPRGASTVYLKRPPAEPRYSIIQSDYVKCRDAFLSSGFSENPLLYCDECERLAKAWDDYKRIPNADPADGFDQFYPDVAGVCRRAAECIRDFHAAVGESATTPTLRRDP